MNALESDTWTTVLVAALAFNAVLGLGYRIYRRTRGGPITDVWGQAALAVALGGICTGLIAQLGWMRWVALAYGALFAVAVMPIWTLAVLIPLPPEGPDYAFAVVYWVTLIIIVIAALAA